MDTLYIDMLHKHVKVFLQ